MCIRDRPDASARADSVAASFSLTRRAGFQNGSAASLLAIGFSVWNYGDLDPITPVDRPRSLAKLYQETKDHGFRPYYDCRDMDRFADVFKNG